MTALAGYFAFGSDDPAARCAAMLEAQAIYGQETRYATAGAAALGRRLWPLTPEDAFDTGPLTGQDGRLLLCADARIDNRGEVVAALSLPAGHDQMSDAAIVLAAYERWGDGAFDRLYGAFAVIIWDTGRQCLTLARDPLGERPLHYHVGDGFVAVASMPKGLHALPAIPYAASTRSMADFLALVPETGSDSFFEGVARVPPGHVTVIDNRGRESSTSYWHPATDMLQLSSDADYAASMRGALDDAVACRLRRAKGLLGSHLSAGLDSSSVTATAARLAAPDRLLAFTAVPAGNLPDREDAISDEGPLAAATAQKYANVDHVQLQTGGTSALTGMDRHFRVFERPILNPSNAVWNDAINDAAQARGVSVMLTGQMGNMSISHDGTQLLSQLARVGALPALFALMWQMRRRGHRWPGLAAQAFGPFMPPAMWLWLARKFDRALDLELYSALKPAAFDGFAVGQRARERGLDLSYRPWADSRAMRLWVLRRVDLGVYNKGTLAAWGIDQRDPTADRRLIELSLRIPERQFILDGETRSLARRAFADRLPASVVSERRRGVQAADWRLGVANALPAIGEELAALERNPQARELIDLERLKRAYIDWPGTEPTTEASTWLYRDAMLRGLAAGHFLRKVGRTN
jgi:asparagine synthase (glutamine-hydrolysing)